MLKLETKSMTNAIQKARAIRPKVRVISADERKYAVYGSRGDAYTVRFVIANGHKLAECDCPARGMCYHIAAAASVNIGVQSMRRQAVEKTAPVSSRANLIADIKSTYAAKFPNDNLSDALMCRFKVNSLDFLADGFLRDILAAIL